MPGFFDLSKYRAKAIYVSKCFCLENHLAVGKMKKNLLKFFFKQLPLGNECNMRIYHLERETLILGINSITIH